MALKTTCSYGSLLLVDNPSGDVTRCKNPFDVENYVYDDIDVGEHEMLAITTDMFNFNFGVHDGADWSMCC